MSEDWWLLEDGPHGAAENMARDEVLLEAMPSLGCPVLRFYEWHEPTATFGYSQRYVEVQRMTAVRPLIRRPTGGGLVIHGHDFTYTFAVPALHPWYALRAAASYARMHEWVRQAVAALGIPAGLAPQPQPGLAGACFARAEQNDVVAHGTKVAGAAQKRTREGLLIQGSVCLSSREDRRTAWQQAMVQIARATWAVNWRSLPWRDPWGVRTTELEAQKYAALGHNHRR